MSVPSTMSKSLLYFNVAFVDISQTLYDSGLNSRRVILLVVGSSAIVCLLVCFACFEPLFFCVESLTMQDVAFYLALEEIGFACADCSYAGCSASGQSRRYCCSACAPVVPSAAKPTVLL